MTTVPAAPSRTEAGAQVVRVPPPLYFAAAFAAAVVLSKTGTPLAFHRTTASVVAGILVLVTGATLAAAGVAHVVRAGTTIVPHHPVAQLQTTGVYAASRNPMYTGLAIAYLGGAVLSATWWPMITLPVALLAIVTLVIRPEERYLHSRFGTTYTTYRTHVRRWL